MRIAMLINGYFPRIGGAERVLGAVAPILQSMGVEVHILTRRFPSMEPFEHVDGIPVFRLPIPGPKALASFSYTLSALRLLRKIRPDVIHAHDLFSTATAAVSARRLWNTPVVATVHRSGSLGDIYRLQHKLFGKRRLDTFRRQIDAFVVISSEIGAELASLDVPAERRILAPNGVDTDRFRPLNPGCKQQLRTKLNFPEAPIAVFAGRLAAEKRVNHLINIWPAVRRLVPDALLLVLGDGPETLALRRLAGDGVRFEGGIEDVRPYLQAADLFILPSVAEGLSVAVLEAQATGLPTLVTDVGGARDMIDHGQNGWLIPPDDPDALKTAVLKLLGDPRLRAQLGEAARMRVTRDFALPIVAKQLRDVYAQLLA